MRDYLKKVIEIFPVVTGGGDNFFSKCENICPPNAIFWNLLR